MKCKIRSKKMCSLVLALIMLLLFAVPVSAGGPYSDVSSSDWFYAPVDQAVTDGEIRVIYGNTFAPYSKMTRGLFVRAIGEYQGINTSWYTGSSFKDVKSTASYAPHVEWAEDMGICNGVGYGNFAPEGSLTREQAALIIYRYMDRWSVPIPEESKTHSFTDVDSLSAESQKVIAGLYRRGIMNGTSKTTFSPKSTLNRAQAAQLIYNLRHEFGYRTGVGSYYDINLESNSTNFEGIANQFVSMYISMMTSLSSGHPARYSHGWVEDINVYETVNGDGTKFCFSYRLVFEPSYNITDHWAGNTKEYSGKAGYLSYSRNMKLVKSGGVWKCENVGTGVIRL